MGFFYLLEVYNLLQERAVTALLFDRSRLRVLGTHKNFRLTWVLIDNLAAKISRIIHRSNARFKITWQYLFRVSNDKTDLATTEILGGVILFWRSNKRVTLGGKFFHLVRLSYFRAMQARRWKHRSLEV